MQLYSWVIWKNCRIVECIQAYSEWDAMKIAKIRYGDNVFVERSMLANNSLS